MTWHVDAESTEWYVAGGLDMASASSIESHLLVCDRCRAAVGSTVDPELLSFVWSEISNALDRPQLGWGERLLRRLGCSDATSRLVAATTRARFSYVIAVAMSVAMAALAAWSGDDRSFGMFLVLAPIGPLFATATAYGRWADPAHAVLSTTPTSALQMVLLRTAASVVPAIVLTGLSLPLLAGRGWLALAWLLPTLALSLGALGLATWVDLEIASLFVGAGWLLTPVLIRVPGGALLDAFAKQLQLASIAVGAIGVLTMVLRRDRFENREVR